SFSIIDVQFGPLGPLSISKGPFGPLEGPFAVLRFSNIWEGPRGRCAFRLIGRHLPGPSSISSTSSSRFVYLRASSYMPASSSSPASCPCAARPPRPPCPCATAFAEAAAIRQTSSPSHEGAQAPSIAEPRYALFAVDARRIAELLTFLHAASAAAAS